ncbi:InlB B-repeat-containing protein [bacterium]|nr:InlB B-repeat-containing protein [bacterium]
MKNIFLLLVILTSLSLLSGCFLDKLIGNKEEETIPPSVVLTTINGIVTVPDAGAGKITTTVNYKPAPSTTRVYLLLSSKTWVEKLDYLKNYEYMMSIDLQGNFQFDHAVKGTNYCIIIDINADGKCDDLISDIIAGDKSAAEVTSFVRELNSGDSMMLSISLDKIQYAEGEKMTFKVKGYIAKSGNLHVEVWDENGNGKNIWSSIPVTVTSGEVSKEFTHTIPMDSWSSTSTGADYKAFAAIDTKLLASEKFEISGTNAVIDTFTVTFNSDGGSAIPDQTRNYGSIVAEPTPPTKAGSYFAGWYKDTALTLVWQFGIDTVKADIVLYAKWTNSDYDIIFPPTNSAQKIKDINYSLGEDAKSGLITWTCTSGVDNGNTRLRVLAGAELLAGNHTITDSPLIAESVYNVMIEYTSLASGVKAVEKTHTNVFYTLILPVDPNPANFAFSNRTGKVNVIGNNAVPEKERLRIYLNDILVGETEYLGPGGLNYGDTPFLGISEQAPNSTVKYATVNYIAGYTHGVESNRVSDGIVPAPPDHTKIFYSDVDDLFHFLSSINGNYNTNNKLKIITTGAGARTCIKTAVFGNDNAGTLDWGVFTPNVAGITANTTLSYTIIETVNGNESSVTSDGIIPDQPTAAYLSSGANGANNTDNFMNIQSQDDPIIRVTPVNGQRAEEQIFATVFDGVTTKPNVGETGIANSTDGSPVDVTISDCTPLLERPTVNTYDHLTVKAYIKDSITGNISTLYTGTSGTKDVTRPVITTIEIYDTDDPVANGDAPWAESIDGFIDKMKISFTEKIKTDDNTSPVAADFGTIVFPDGFDVDFDGEIYTPIFSNPLGLVNYIEITRMEGQNTEDTSPGTTSIDGITAGKWKDLSGNRNDSAMDDSETIIDCAPPLLLTVMSNNPLTSDNVVFGTIFTMDFSEEVIKNIPGFTDNQNNMMSVFTSVSNGVDAPKIWGDGSPDTLDGVGITVDVSSGDITLTFNGTTVSNAWSNSDFINILATPNSDVFEDAAGNDIVHNPANPQIQNL